MATKQLHTIVRDDGLNAIVSACDAGNLAVRVCEGEPATYTEATTAKGSGGKALTASQAYAAVDDTLQNVGAESGIFAGREVLLAAKSGVSVTDSSVASPDLTFAVVDTTNSRLLAVMEETSDQALTSGNTVDIPALTIRLPSSVT